MYLYTTTAETHQFPQSLLEILGGLGRQRDRTSNAKFKDAADSPPWVKTPGGVGDDAIFRKMMLEFGIAVIKRTIGLTPL